MITNKWAIMLINIIGAGLLAASKENWSSFVDPSTAASIALGINLLNSAIAGIMPSPTQDMITRTNKAASHFRLFTHT